MLISGLAQVNGFYDNIKLTDVEKKEDTCLLFQAVANIIDDPDDHLYAYWWPCWRFRQEASADWYITLRDDYMICERVNGCSSVGLSLRSDDHFQQVRRVRKGDLIRIYDSLRGELPVS